MRMKPPKNRALSPAVGRAILTRLRAEPKPGYAMFPVVLREMLNLAQSTSYKQ
jgi:hypothetical protein